MIRRQDHHSGLLTPRTKSSGGAGITMNANSDCKAATVLGDITNKPGRHNRAISFCGAKLRSQSTPKGKPSAAHKRSSSTSCCTPQKHYHHFSPSEHEENENDNPNQLQDNPQNNHQLVVYEGSPAAKSPPKLITDTSIHYQDCQWLNDYRPIQIPRSVTPIQNYPRHQLQGLVPIPPTPPHIKRLLKMAKEYARWSKYRVGRGEIKNTEGLRCVNCSKKGNGNTERNKIEKVFFPCEHMCVCNECAEERRFEVCPLPNCRQRIKLILDNTGTEHQQFDDWLTEFPFYMPEEFVKRFKKNSRKVIKKTIFQATGEEYIFEDENTTMGKVTRLASKVKVGLGQKMKALVSSASALAIVQEGGVSTASSRHEDLNAPRASAFTSTPAAECWNYDTAAPFMSRTSTSGAMERRDSDASTPRASNASRHHYSDSSTAHASLVHAPIAVKAARSTRDALKDGHPKHAEGYSYL